MIKDVSEDWKRHKSDNKENNEPVKRYDFESNYELKETKWSDLKVGDIVKVKCDEFFPAD